MRLKLDENLPVELLDDLRAAGHEADGLREEGLIGAPDDVVLDLVDDNALPAWRLLLPGWRRLLADDPAGTRA